MGSIIRQPYISVTVNGVALSNVVSARARRGFSQQVAEATVVVALVGPAYTLPALEPWDEVVITLGASQATAQARFTGYFVRADRDLDPVRCTLACRGKLARADTFSNDVDIDMSSYASYVHDPPLDNDYGHSDAVMVSTVLVYTGVFGNVAYDDTNPWPGIEGTGRVLGKTALGSPWVWRAGQPGLQFINQVDQVSWEVDGGYRTFDTAAGSVVRQKVSTVPSGSPDWTFTEGVDITRGQDTATILEARNRVVVEGWPGKDGKDAISYTVEAANPFLLHNDGSQWYLSQKISSPMIEHELDAGAVGLSCENVAKGQLTESNAWAEKCSWDTYRDELVEPGDLAVVDSPNRLGLAARLLWVQDVETAVEGPQFSQSLTGIARIPLTESRNGAVMAVTASGSAWAVAPAVQGDPKVAAVTASGSAWAVVPAVAVT